MKTQVTKLPEPPPAFKPVSVTFTFETQDELDAFGALFNIELTMNALRTIVPGLYLYSHFQEAGADLYRFDTQLVNALKQQARNYR